MGTEIELVILYLGRRGGGAKVASSVSQDLEVSKIFEIASICIRSDNELAEHYDQSKVITLFEDLRSANTLIKLLKYAVAPKKLLTDMHLLVGGICLVPMISPLGLIIETMLRAQHVTIVRLLHDFEKHPGENWPPNILIRHIIKRSSFLIALSNDVAEKIRHLNPSINVAVYPHPSFDFSSSQTSVKILPKYVLFVGRIRKYKGVENLIRAFSQLNPTGVELVIAGEGKINSKIDKKIKVINRWLEEEEIANLIKGAEVVAFPYLEASQSGLIPYCVSQNKKIVITPLPGLLEQTHSYKNAFLVKNLEVKNLTLSLDDAIRAETLSTMPETQPSKNIEECLIESGFFPKK